MKFLIRYILVPFLLCNCTKEKAKTLFELKSAKTGIQFSNDLSYTEEFNPYVYRNFYNGGGVAVGDINNDGLDDIYFTGNLVDNKLYLNKGNWQFEDITVKASVTCSNVWSTGATFIDINADGFLDLYVCKSGKPGGKNRNNELFINNGDLTFSEQSKEYGLDITGLSVQAGFFDYDKDGDLDCYLLSNSIKSVGGFDLVKDQRKIPDANGQGNKLLRNDNGKFYDVTAESGIYSSSIGFGLGVTFGDFNNDNWPDIYVSNDFFERDYLYINNTTGGFEEDLESYFSSTSMGAMGADYGDLNNDLLPELMVTEMLPKTENRKKRKTIFENWDKQQLAKKQGYFNQFARNTLQRNIPHNGFIDIGRQSQISDTEWSWSVLFFDANNNGLKDIFISNGIYKDLLDRDYLTYEANDEIIQNKINSNEKNVIKKLIDAMPSKAVSNCAFENLSSFKFKDVSGKWGLNHPSFSNGSTYVDIDNDGDLDLLVNNVNMSSFVYENHSDTLSQRSITIKLKQANSNINAIGSKVIIIYDGKRAFAENYNARGFQSSPASTIHFGVGSEKKIDSLYVIWPDDSRSLLTDLKTNESYLINKNQVNIDSNSDFPNLKKSRLLQKAPEIFEYTHKENKFIDFNRERLLTQMYSNEGPAFTRADINNDSIYDFFVGGAKNHTSRVFVSEKSTHKEIILPFEKTIGSEAVNAQFFDADQDGDEDLYVCHGGKAFSNYSPELNDIIYENVNGSFVEFKSQPKFPKNINTSTVVNADFDKDGDLDLFIGERFITQTYGLPGSGYLLVNNGKGEFTVISPKNMKDIGMITDAAWADIDNDGWLDLIIVGEWMPLKIYKNVGGKLLDISKKLNLQNTQGLWNSLKILDIDNDGDQDIIAGNLGTNTFFETTMKMYVADFDKNGFQEQIICKKVGDNYYPIIDKDELISQIPSLKKKLVYYEDYANSSISSIFGEKALQEAYKIDLNFIESTIFLNDQKQFKAQSLPIEIQTAPIYAIEKGDFNEDGHIDLFFGGNQHLVKPQFGSYDGSMGWLMYGPSFTNSKNKIESLGIRGQIRALDWLPDKKILSVVRNNENILFFKPNE
jgi:hypothetical protein